MFFEFVREDSLRGVDESPHAFDLDEREVAAVRRQMLGIVELEKLVHLTELLEKLRIHWQGLRDGCH
jgi:hypothetical protein